MTRTNLFSLLIILFTSFSSFAQNGIKGEYFLGRNFETKKFTRIDKEFNFNWPNGVSPGPGVFGEEYSARWTGKLLASVDGKYNFHSKVDDGIRVWVGGVKVIDAWGMHDSEAFAGSVNLKANTYYDLKVEYFNGLLEGELHLYWNTPNSTIGSDILIPAANLFQPSQPVPVSNNVVPKPTTKPVAKPVAPVKPATINKPAAHVTPPPTKKPIAVTRDTIEKYTPKNILFEQSTDKMIGSSFDELDRLIRLLKKYPDLKVTIGGHTDNVGDAHANQVLSEDRAKAVGEYLNSNGIAYDRIKAIGYGDKLPISKDNSVVAHAKNRRVEFIIQ